MLWCVLYGWSTAAPFAYHLSYCAGNDHDASFSLEDIQPAKSRAAPPKKAPSIQKSIQELTQEFKDLLSEKVCTVLSPFVTEVCL